MQLRLVAYTPLGDRLGELPDALAFTVTDPFGSDLSTLKIEYTKTGRRFPLLETKPEVAVEWWDGTGWFEPEDARFHVVKRSWNATDDGSQARAYDAVHVGWLARRARVWTDPATMNSEGKRQFNAANAGTIVGTLMGDAQARGWGPGLGRSFTATHDSAGAPWARTINLSFDPSADLQSVIAAMVDQGLADVRWSGRTLEMFNPDSVLARDLTLGTAPAWLRLADGVTSAPEEGTIEGLVTAARLVGDAGATWDVANPAADQTYGRLEGYVTQAGVTDEGTANLLIEQELTAGASERVQYTREWDAAEAKVLPWKSYRPGDWVFVDVTNGEGEVVRDRLRVVQVSLTCNANGVSGHTTLGTRLDDLLTRLQRRTAAVTGGATSGGAGGSPSPSGPDSRSPAAVVGLVGSSDVYFDATGTPQARVALDWADVTTDEVNQPLAIRGYEVWRRIGGGTFLLVTSVVESHLEMSPLPVDAVMSFRVRAISENYAAGPWSNTITLTTAEDTDGPPAPSAPVMDSRLGVLSLTWNGLPAMPADWSHTVIELAYDGADWHPAGEAIRTRVGGTALVAGLPYGEEVAARAIAYDTSGNPSAPSAIAWVNEVHQVSGPDLAAGAVKANHIEVGALDGTVITGALFQTTATALRGIKYDAAGLRAYNTTGTKTFEVLPGGDVALAGTFRSGFSGARVIIDAGTSDIRLHSSVASEMTPASLLARHYGPPDAPQFQFPYVRLASPQSTAITGRTPSAIYLGANMNNGNSNGGSEYPGARGGGLVQIAAGRFSVGCESMYETTESAGLGNTAFHVHSGEFPEENTVEVSGTLYVGNGLVVNANGFTAQPAGNVVLNPGTNFIATPSLVGAIDCGSAFRVRTGANTTDALHIATTGIVSLPRTQTTTNAGNTYMTSGWGFYRGTSRRDAKLVIEEIPLDRVRSLLDLSLVSWFDRVAAETYASELSGEIDHAEVSGPLVRIPGLVAEDVEDVGLPEFVQYDLEGNVMGLAYERIGVAWIPLVRELFDRIKTLEERNA